MKPKELWLKTDAAEAFFDPKSLADKRKAGAEHLRELFNNPALDAGDKGWLAWDCAAGVLPLMEQKAAEIRRHADLFVLVGVGGSNQSARAAVKALGSSGPEILYAGNTLSGEYLADILRRMEGKSVYLNVIAKNFQTLEPGSHFRVLRSAMARRYSAQELARRIVVTGTQGSPFWEIAQTQGYTFLPFPGDIGGRYSAFSAVGLFPLMVAGLDVGAMLAGARRMRERIEEGQEDNPALSYAVLRNAAYEKGYDIEVLATFEPRLEYLLKWWVQLFGESEGKCGKGSFPAAAVYSEDLHSMGQYLQEGRRNLLEIFIRVEDPGPGLAVPADKGFGDDFDYLDGMNFNDIAKAAYDATLEAHGQGGVPCVEVGLPKLDEYGLGQLFYFFMAACAVSGKLLGVNPFDQPGVEAYKRSMMARLGR